MVPRNSTPGGFAYIWHSEWVGIIAIKTERTQIHFLSDVFIAVASLDLKVPSNAAPHASNTWYWENLVLVVVLVLESKGLYYHCSVEHTTCIAPCLLTFMMSPPNDPKKIFGGNLYSVPHSFRTWRIQSSYVKRLLQTTRVLSNKWRPLQKWKQSPPFSKRKHIYKSFKQKNHSKTYLGSLRSSLFMKSFASLLT